MEILAVRHGRFGLGLELGLGPGFMVRVSSITRVGVKVRVSYSC